MGAVDTRRAVSLLAHGDVLQHVVGAGVDPDGVVHDSVHDRIGITPDSSFDASPSSRDLVLNTVDAVS